MEAGTARDDKAGRLAQAFRELQAGRAEPARATFAELMHDPQHGTDAHRGLAAVAWRQRQPDSALQLLRFAVERHPDHAEARADLALLLLLSGRAAESLPHWDHRLRLMPDDPMTWHNYANALVAADRLDAAFKAFEQALVLAPDQAKTYEAYARALAAGRRPTQAEAVWRRGLARLPKLEAMHLGLVALLFERGHLEQCLAAYREGVAVLPESADLHMGLGQILEDFGDNDGAERQFRRALELRPGWAIPVEALLTLLREGASEVDLDAARSVLADARRPPADHANAAFGLGKALDARGDRDGAFAAWNLANAARRRQVGPYDRDALVRRVDRLIGQFTVAFLQARRDWGSPDRRPIFVLGMPRSGTSLVEQILSAHPEAYGYGELTELGRIIEELPARLGSLQRWPEVAAALRPEAARAAAADYLARLEERHPTTAARVVDKAPMNFFHIGLIALLFPAAHIVWCRRDPRDICTSIYSENFGLSQVQATDLADLGFFFRQHLRLMRHWLQVAGSQIYSCRYEELIAEPEAQSRRLVEAVGLDWDERCLRFHEAPRPVLTPSRWQVRSPIYRGSVGRWKRYEKHLGPLLQALGEDGDG